MLKTQEISVQKWPGYLLGEKDNEKQQFCANKKLKTNIKRIKLAKFVSSLGKHPSHNINKYMVLLPIVCFQSPCPVLALVI